MLHFTSIIKQNYISSALVKSFGLWPNTCKNNNVINLTRDLNPQIVEIILRQSGKIIMMWGTTDRHVKEIMVKIEEASILISDSWSSPKHGSRNTRFFSLQIAILIFIRPSLPQTMVCNAGFQLHVVTLADASVTNTHRNKLAFSVFLKSALTCGLNKLGIELLTLRLVDNLLYIPESQSPTTPVKKIVVCSPNLDVTNWWNVPLTTIFL